MGSLEGSCQAGLHVCENRSSLGPCRHQNRQRCKQLRWLAALSLHRSAALPACLQLGRYEEALADYEAALALDPSSSYAHYNAGIARDRLGDYDAAVAAFSAAIELEPGNADFYHVSAAGRKDPAGSCSLPQSACCDRLTPALPWGGRLNKSPQCRLAALATAAVVLHCCACLCAFPLAHC